MKKITTEIFTERARKVHGDKYDYSKSKYINSLTKICIICPKHGEFWQRIDAHLNGQGCPECRKEKIGNSLRKNVGDFINQAHTIHKNKYDYSKVEYKNTHSKVCIICPEHGEFWQTPNCHLNGCGCPKCSNKKISKLKQRDSNTFIKLAKKLHGEYYNYSKTNYINSKIKVCIICPVHGEFWQAPDKHLQGQGCPQCKGKNISKTKTRNNDQFINEAMKIHGDKYDYSRIHYIDCHQAICIICPEHGEFWQTPNKHLQGHGCPKCNSSKLETEIRSFLQDKNIIFEEQKHFDWLGKQSLDFYIPDLNIAIECQGGQHYRPVHFFGGQKGFEATQQRDSKKKQLCEANNIKMLYYTHEDIVPDTATYFTQIELINALDTQKTRQLTLKDDPTNTTKTVSTQICYKT